MKPTESNFDKVRRTTIDKWLSLSGHQKKTFWDLHKQYPEKHLLDHIESHFKLDDDTIKDDIKQTNSIRVKIYSNKNAIKYEEKDTALKERIEQIEEDIVEKHEEIAKLKKEKSQLNLRLNELRSEVTNTIKESAKIEKEFLLHQIECVKINADLNAKIKILEDKVKENTMKIEQLEKITEDLRKELKIKESEIMEIRLELKDKTIQLRDKDVEILTIQNQMRKMQDNHQSEIKRLEENYRNLQICHEKQVLLNANNK